MHPALASRPQLTSSSQDPRVAGCCRPTPERRSAVCCCHDEGLVQLSTALRSTRPTLVLAAGVRLRSRGSRRHASLQCSYMCLLLYNWRVRHNTGPTLYVTLTQADGLLGLGLTPLGAALKRPRHSVTLHTHYIRGVDECTAPGPSGFSVTSCVGPTHTPPAPSAHPPPPTPLAPVSPNQLELASAARA